MKLYIPPHRRQTAGTPTRGESVPDLKRKKQEPQTKMDIRYIEGARTNLYVLCSQDRRLQFQVFDSGESPFSGINIHVQRYRLSFYDPQAGPSTPTDPWFPALLEEFEGLGLDAFQGQRVTERLDKDFTAALENFARCLKGPSPPGEYQKPELWLRFGRLTFYGMAKDSDARLEEIRPFLGIEIEQEQLRRSSKTRTWPIRAIKELNPTLPQSIYEKLQTLAQQGGQERLLMNKEEEFFILQIGTEEHNEKGHLYCSCKSDGETLRIHKIKRGPQRCLVADLTWAKELDLRLMLSTETVCQTLSVSAVLASPGYKFIFMNSNEALDRTLTSRAVTGPSNVLKVEETEAVNDIVSGAVLDPQTKEGIRWPRMISDPGSSTRSGLVLKLVRRRTAHKVKEQNGRVWRFVRGHSFDHLKGEPGPASLEVNLRLQSWKSGLKDLQAGQQETGEIAGTILHTFPSIIQWLYDNTVCKGAEG